MCPRSSHAGMAWRRHGREAGGMGGQQGTRARRLGSRQGAVARVAWLPKQPSTVVQGVTFQVLGRSHHQGSARGEAGGLRPLNQHIGGPSRGGLCGELVPQLACSGHGRAAGRLGLNSQGEQGGGSNRRAAGRAEGRAGADPGRQADSSAGPSHCLSCRSIKVLRSSYLRRGCWWESRRVGEPTIGAGASRGSKPPSTRRASAATDETGGIQGHRSRTPRPTCSLLSGCTSATRCTEGSASCTPCSSPQPWAPHPRIPPGRLP